MTNTLSAQAYTIIDAAIKDIEGGWPQDTERCPAYRNIAVYDAAARTRDHLTPDEIEAVYWVCPEVEYTAEYRDIMQHGWPGYMTELTAALMVAMKQRVESVK